jgi:multidrug efflux system membrane fusion protein
MTTREKEQRVRHATSLTIATLVVALAACGGDEPAKRAAMEPAAAGRLVAVIDTTITATFPASGIADPLRRATLSTRLMGSVTEVLVEEGARVRAGALLAQIDARDLAAKRAQVEAAISAAEAMHRDALTQAERFRSLYADSVATRHQLEQVETGLARAEAGLREARAAREELDAVGDYSAIRAPFAGIVTARHVDPGAFVAPGAPIVEVQEQERLRITVQVPASVARTLRPGQAVDAEVEGAIATAEIEGIVPAPTGGVYVVNALVRNPEGALSSGGAATLFLPEGTRRALLVPAGAVVREGDLTGVRVRTASGPELRWVRLAERPARAEAAAMVEILSGLSAGDSVLLLEGN